MLTDKKCPRNDRKFGHQNLISLNRTWNRTKITGSVLSPIVKVREFQTVAKTRKNCFNQIGFDAMHTDFAQFLYKPVMAIVFSLASPMDMSTTGP